VKAATVVSSTGRSVREYRLTASGRKQLEAEQTNYHRIARGIAGVLGTA
jgi:hypothetical protein